MCVSIQALGKVITAIVYDLLESRVNLLRAPVPADRGEFEPSTVIFYSPDAFSKDKLMVSD
jgi:hypothetical protein